MIGRQAGGIVPTPELQPALEEREDLIASHCSIASHNPDC
jgi:hypothetical protein